MLGITLRCEKDPGFVGIQAVLNQVVQASLSATFRLIFRPEVADPELQIWISDIHHTGVNIQGEMVHIVDLLSNYSSDFDPVNHTLLTNVNDDMLRLVSNGSFVEFLQKESWPSPVNPVQGLDYFYCIEPWSLQSSLGSTGLVTQKPKTRHPWILEFNLTHTSLTSQESQLLQNINGMLEPLTRDRHQETMSELTGIRRTKTIPGDPGAILCRNGFRTLLQQLNKPPCFITSLRALTAKSSELATITVWLQSVLMPDEPVTTITGLLSSSRGQQLLNSCKLNQPSLMNTTEIWDWPDSPQALKRLHRMLSINQATQLLSRVVSRAVSAQVLPEPKSPIIQPTDSVDQSMYRSFFVNQRCTENNQVRKQTTNQQSCMLPSRYQILKQLGSGGMGDVYHVIDQELDHEFAIKILKQSISNQPERIKQFKQEVNMTRELSHPGIVRMHHFDRFQDSYYCVMEYVSGVSLSQKISSMNRGFDQESIRFILIQVCDAMQSAHEQGILHRDIKPGNIILLPNNKVKILDFGLAVLSSTQEQALAGSMGYMAPEIMNQSADERSDIYSLGATGYEMITCAKPGGYISQDFGVPHGVSEPFNRIILRALHTDPDQRFQSMEAFKDALFETT